MQSQPSVHVGQVWEDTYLSQSALLRPWLVKVMKLNAKSVRVEPVEHDDWYTPVGYCWQYRMENRHFDRGRMRLVQDAAVALGRERAS